MIKYELYREKSNGQRDALIVDKHSICSSKNKTLSDVNEFNDIVMRFIEQGFEVSYSNGNLVLSNKSCQFMLKNYQEIINCSYLARLKQEISTKIDLDELKVFDDAQKEERERLERAAREEEKSKKEKKNSIKGFFKRAVALASAASLAIGLYAGTHFSKSKKKNEPSTSQSMLLQASSLDKASIDINGTNNKVDASIQNEEQHNFDVIGSDNELEEIKKRFIVSRNFSNTFDYMAAYSPQIPFEEPVGNFIDEEPDETIEEPVQEVDYEALRQQEYDNYLTMYASYYNFDGEKVKSFARELTSDYTIPFSEVVGKTTCDVSTPEASALVFCSKLYANKLEKKLSKYGLSVDYFSTGDSIRVMDSDHLLSNGLTYEQFYGYVCDTIGANKYYSLAICYLESGRLTSKLTYSKNNFGGIGGSGHFSTFPSPEAGIIAHARILKEYESKNFTSLSDLSGYYVNGKRGTSAPSWVSGVTSLKNEIVERQDELFLDSEIVRQVLYGEVEDLTPVGVEILDPNFDGRRISLY